MILKKLIFLGGLICCLLSFKYISNSTIESYKCLVQLTNYKGEGAYVIATLVDQNDQYIQTLKVIGIDDEWYPDLDKWWAFHKIGEDIGLDGITAATVSPGERAIFSFDIDTNWIDKGYKIRFETAVEDQKYVQNELSVELKSDQSETQFEGSDYIRYVRLIPSR